MAQPELQNYIIQSRAAGMSDDQIRQNLMGQGWNLDDVNQAFGGNSAVPPTITAPAKSYTKLVVIILLIAIVLPLLIWGGIVGLGYYALKNINDTATTPSYSPYPTTISPTPILTPSPTLSPISVLTPLPTTVPTQKPQTPKTPTSTPIPTPAPTWHAVGRYTGHGADPSNPPFAIKGSKFRVTWTRTPDDAESANNPFSYDIRDGFARICGSGITNEMSGSQECVGKGQSFEVEVYNATKNSWVFIIEEYY